MSAAVLDRLTGHVGDLGCAVVWLATFRYNRETWPDAVACSDSDLRPARLAQISKRLGLPAETVRRRATQLVAQGACAWEPAGLVVSEASLAEPGCRPLIDRSCADLVQMYATLGQFGVIARWRAESGLLIHRAA
jgi:hypothetical protein